jgi:hypothetical protein
MSPDSSTEQLSISVGPALMAMAAGIENRPTISPSMSSAARRDHQPALGRL